MSFTYTVFKTSIYSLNYAVICTICLNFYYFCDQNYLPNTLNNVQMNNKKPEI